MINNKLIVESIELRNRLIYLLNLKITQNVKEVTNYHSREYIKKYYQDVTDFTPQESSIILLGLPMIKNWIYSKPPQYTLYDRIIHMEEEEEEKKEEEKKEEEKNLDFIPYFIQLTNLDNNIYIAQLASSIENAMYISYTWNIKGYNPRKGVEIMNNIPFKYISYNNPVDYSIVNIGIHRIEDKENIILEYKKNNIIYTMALLKYK
jgi:Icc-related predicted phosphoesterase